MLENRRQLLDEGLDTLLSELPSTMEDSDSALLAKEWQHGIGFRLQGRSDVHITETFTGCRSLGPADHTTLIVLLIHRVEVDRLGQQRGWQRLVVHIFRFESFLDRGAAFEAAGRRRYSSKSLLTIALRETLALVLIFGILCRLLA